MELRNCSVVTAAIVVHLAGPAGVWADFQAVEAFRIEATEAPNSSPYLIWTKAEGTERLPEHREPPAKHLTAATGTGIDPKPWSRQA
jgi:hypothetical protein